MSFIIRFQAADGQPLKIVYYLRVWSMLSGSLMEHLQNSCNYSVSLCTRCYLEARCFKSCARSQHSSLSRRCSDQVAIMGKLKTAFLCYQWAWGHCLLRGCGCCYLCHLTHRNQLWYITKHSGQIWPHCSCEQHDTVFATAHNQIAAADS